MAFSSWFRGPKPCSATSPTGYWCTRTDRHAEHRAQGGSGRVHASWRGDFPSEDQLFETFTTEEGMRKAVGNDPAGDPTAAAHNDAVAGRRRTGGGGGI